LHRAGDCSGIRHFIDIYGAHKSTACNCYGSGDLSGKCQAGKYVSAQGFASQDIACKCSRLLSSEESIYFVDECLRSFRIDFAIDEKCYCQQYEDKDKSFEHDKK